MKVETEPQPAARFDLFVHFYGSFLIFAALIIGGGGAEGPIFNGLLEALAVPLLIAVVASHFGRRPLPNSALVPVVGAVLVLLLFLFQLLPLPPVIWTALPGRELAVSMASVTGHAGDWKPLSLDPEATRRAAAGLLLPIALMLLTIRSDIARIGWIIRAILFGAACSALLGAVQIANDTPARLTFYGDPVPGVGTGFFANPNHQASLMLLALVVVGLYVRLQSPSVQMHVQGRTRKFKLGWFLAPLFIVGTLASQSRAGFLLLLPAIAFSALIGSDNRSTRRIAVMAGISLAAIVGVFLLTRAHFWEMLPGGSKFLQDARATSLPDILYTLRQYWPWGSGFGTFVPVFMANEDLDLVQAAYLNHAHNDFLELLIEAGLPGAILLATTLIAIVWRLATLARGGPNLERTPALAAFAMLVLLAAHSLVDYPARSDAIGAVAGVALGLLFVRIPRKSGKRSSTGGKRGFSTPGGSGRGRGQ